MDPKQMLGDPDFVALIPIISEKLEVSTDILWKDLMVFLVLRELVSTKNEYVPDLKERLVFKGGTSLSKCYRLIDRILGLQYLLLLTVLHNSRAIVESSLID